MGKVIKAIAGAVLFVAGVVTGNPLLIGLGLSTASSALQPNRPKASTASTDRLKASLDPRAPRKIVFGHTAAATDVHYQEFTGTNQGILNTILVLSSHELQAIEDIWFDDKVAVNSGGTIGSSFAGFLTATLRTVGTVANAFTITGSTSWTSSASRLVGCAYLWLRYDLSADNSPFANNVTSRITVRVKGAKLYDPRLDSTVGGSGSHRATDQTTWAWVSDDVGRNPALQLLWFLLGWRIQNPADSTWKLAVGLGLPVARIDLASFMAAANICDEAVTLAAGGTEPRYRSDGVFSEGDDPQAVFEALLAAMNGVLRDAGGKLTLDILHNDLGSPVVDLTAADVIGEFTWVQTPPIDQHFNAVRGKYVDPSDAGLYQLVDYPDVSIASTDGIDRSRTLDLPTVQSASQAQRLAKTFLQRAQYPGTFTAEFLASAWRCQVGSVVRLTFPALGFTTKLFRVAEHSIRYDGRCPMVLREENAAIYAWSASEAPAVVAAAPISYLPSNDPVLQSLAEAYALAGARGRVWITPTAPTYAESNPGDTWVAPDGTFYDRVGGLGLIVGGYAVTVGGFRPIMPWARSMTQPSTLADWPTITGAAKPEDNADVTSSILGLAEVVLAADYTGAITTALPKVQSYKFSRNGVDLTASAAWSVQVLSGTVSASIGAATGDLSLAAVSGTLTSASLRITAIYSGTTRVFDVKVTVERAAAPVASGGTSSGSFSGSTSSTALTAIGPELTITVGSSGTVALSAYYDFDQDYTEPIINEYARWYRWNGSAYVAIGSEVMSTWAAGFYDGGDYGVYYNSGFGSCNFSDTGRSVGATEKYRLYMRNDTGTHTRTISGTCSAVSS